MTFTTQPLVEGPVFDSALRFAADYTGQQQAGTHDPLIEMGWAATLIPEQDGGVGGNLDDLVAILDALGQHALALPLLERCALTPLLLAAVEQSATRRQWLSGIANGTYTISTLSTTQPDLGLSALTATIDSSGKRFTLQGHLLGTTLCAHATHYLGLAQQTHAKQALIFLIPAAELPAPTKHYRSIDGIQTVDLVFENLNVTSAQCLAQGSSASAAIAAAQNMALLATAIDTVSALGSLLEHTIQYLKTRTQFDVTLSSFQALRHRTVEMYVRYESARGMLQECLRHGLTDPEQTRRLRLLKLCLGDAARFCAQAAIQLHGGMGMSEETLAARLAQRLITNEYRFGDRLFHAKALRETHTS
ncbi:MAG: acyl-CoA dehydrogenase family protein [Alcaligenaceae bacterium]